MNAAALEADLRSMGVACTVEARDGLALLVPIGEPSDFADAGIRKEAVRLAESRGFTHIAIELAESGSSHRPESRPGQ